MINIKQLLQFIQNHWALCSAFGAVLVVLIFEELKNKIGGISKITALDATLLLNHEKTVAIDLRNQKIFANGHILNSINIDRADFDANMKKIESYKNHTVVLVDDNDIKAASVGNNLQKHGFTKVHVLAGGLQTWKDANLPIVRK